MELASRSHRCSKAPRLASIDHILGVAMVCDIPFLCVLLEAPLTTSTGVSKEDFILNCILLFLYYKISHNVVCFILCKLFVKKFIEDSGLDTLCLTQINSTPYKRFHDNDF